MNSKNGGKNLNTNATKDTKEKKHIPDRPDRHFGRTRRSGGLVTIFLCMIQTVISSRIAATDKDFTRLFDKVSFGLIALIYFGLNIALPLLSRLHQVIEK
jgi:hypothetical protein